MWEYNDFDTDLGSENQNKNNCNFDRRIDGDFCIWRTGSRLGSDGIRDCYAGTFQRGPNPNINYPKHHYPHTEQKQPNKQQQQAQNVHKNDNIQRNKEEESSGSGKSSSNENDRNKKRNDDNNNNNDDDNNKSFIESNVRATRTSSKQETKPRPTSGHHTHYAPPTAHSISPDYYCYQVTECVVRPDVPLSRLIATAVRLAEVQFI